MCSVQVNLGGVGKIYKIRLELSTQNTNSRPSWRVKRVCPTSLQPSHLPPTMLPTHHFTITLCHQPIIHHLMSYHRPHHLSTCYHPTLHFSMLSSNTSFHYDIIPHFISLCYHPTLHFSILSSHTSFHYDIIHTSFHYDIIPHFIFLYYHPTLHFTMISSNTSFHYDIIPHFISL